jgi:hypothetical protein
VRVVRLRGAGEPGSFFFAGITSVDCFVSWRNSNSTPVP